MSGQKMRRGCGLRLVMIGAAVLAGVSTVAWGDTRQNTSANAASATLTAQGFANLTGAGVTIGLNESGVPNYANNGTGTTLLANGNANLPAATVSWQAGSNNITNHASETSGVIASTLAGQSGIATSASVLAGNNSDVTTGTVGGNPAGNFGSLHLQSLFQTTQIVNMSWGGTDPANAVNNGNNYISPFVDWGASRYNSLVVVAGNEGNAESPSDAYNIINVGALGVRTNAANNLSYNQFATYNSSNATADGRIGIDLVAAGGDPFSLSANWVPFIQVAANQGTRAAPPANGFINQFVSTAGGVITNSASGAATFSQSDTYNTLGPAATPTADNSTASAWFQFTNGNGILPNGTLVPTTISGTSFAAPLVSGAGALLEQYANRNLGNTNFANNATDPLDHRVLKAILMNGASNINPDGSTLQYQGGAGLQGYTRAPAYTVGGNPVPKQLPAYFNNISVNAQSGLDPTIGAGELNVVNSLVNFAAGEQGVGAVNPTGWDFKTAPSGKPLPVVFNYDFTIGAGQANTGWFNATLAWDSNVSITANPGANFNGNATWQAGSGTAASSTLTRAGLVDLDLYLFTTNPNGSLNQLTAFSNSVVDNVEHIYVPTGLAAGTYELDVYSPANIPTDTPFGVAWATVPEPASLCFLAMISAAMLPQRRRNR